MNSIIKYSLLISLFIYTFTSINFRGIEEYAWVPNMMGILLCFAFVLNLSKIKIEFNYPLLILFILVIWNFVSAFPNPEVFRYFITSSLIFILAFVVYNICVTYPEATEYIKWAFIISLFIQIWISNNFIQYTEWGTVDRHKGTMGNANLYSLFINIAFIFLLQRIGRPKNILKYLLIFAAISLVVFEIINAGSRKGIIFTILIILFYYSNSFMRIGNINKIIYIILGSIFIYQVATYVIDSKYFYRFFQSFYYNEISSSELHRYALAQDGLRMFYEKPIFGWGGDGFRYFNNIDRSYSHMNFIELLVNYGIVGFMLFYSMYIWFFKKLYDKINIKHKEILNDYYIFIFFLFITLVLDIAIVRIFERIYWIIIAMYLGKFYSEQKIDEAKN